MYQEMHLQILHVALHSGSLSMHILFPLQEDMHGMKLCKQRLALIDPPIALQLDILSKHAAIHLQKTMHATNLHKQRLAFIAHLS